MRPHFEIEFVAIRLGIERKGKAILISGHDLADLKALLPADRFDVVPRVEARAGATLKTAPAGTPVLFAPRVWAALTPAQRADPRAVEIRYLIEPKDLAALGEQLGLAPASPRPTRAPPARRAGTA